MPGRAAGRRIALAAKLATCAAEGALAGRATGGDSAALAVFAELDLGAGFAVGAAGSIAVDLRGAGAGAACADFAIGAIGAV